VSPGGHLVTSALAAAGAYSLTGSPVVAAGVVAGGFLIDIDHAADYVLFERQRDLSPGAFLRYYVEGRMRRTVLALHSYELLALLTALAWATGWSWLSGYLLGAAMHLVFDIAVNGRLVPHSLVGFYSFVHRWRGGFETDRLLHQFPLAAAPRGFWTAFFRGSVLAGVSETVPETLARADTAIPVPAGRDR
jgi:hypothetical protein